MQGDQATRLHELTTFRIGGVPVAYFRPSDEGELVQVLADCRTRGLPWRVLGGGSNLLVDEGALPFAVIHICSPGFDTVERSGACHMRVGSGVTTSKLLSCCKEEGLGGLEFLAGLPGTVGGALAGNAGAWGGQISSRLTRVRAVWPDGQGRLLPRSELRFGYRKSPLTGLVVTEAEFQLEPRNREMVALQMACYVRERAQRHPVGLPSAGCVFKNPPGQSAGRLLDLCGLKGRRAGDAEVSDLHANFIVNRGAATAEQVLSLVRIMREAVRRAYGIGLELEVRRWPARARAA
jgi:UDP-N-acetylmuramate dehydrogenase